ncbi:MAG: ABC transporter ATP-binding protein [Bacteroidales bacterium]|nr:ABC transporter ATP-binding protein [Bacteroidales bacterium]
MKDIWRVFLYLKHYPWLITANLLCNMLAVFFNLFTFVMIVPFVELLFGTSTPPAEAPAFALDQETLSSLLTYHMDRLETAYGLWPCLLGIAAGYLSFSFLYNLFTYLARFCMSPIRNGIIRRMRDDVYHKITILPVSYFNARRRGDIVSRMSNDLADIEWGVLTSITSVAKDPLNVIVFSATLIFISPRLFFYFLTILPLDIWLISKVGKSLRRNSNKGQAALGNLFSILEESLGGIRAVKSFGQEESRTGLFGHANGRYAHTMVRVANRRELSSPLSEILITLGLAAILILGGMAVTSGEILSSVFILFVILFARLIPPVQSVVRVYNNLQKANAAATRFFEVMDADESILEKPDALVLDGFGQSIEYRHVSFAYQTDTQSAPVYVLKDINLTIPKGRTVAIVGPSGAGKTTLVDLLPRFYDCTEGEILLDGHPIRDLNIDSLRAQVGLVSQNCILFNDTVANNIAFGHTHYSLDAVRQAAHVAYADDFISQMPEGYDTPVGDRGMNLSGGQRQRLSIARAVLKDPPILILDEATSALDTESEQAVQQALDRLMQGRTCIVIAHRLSTIYRADEIIVMDKGAIVERGTHEQLLDLGGLYKKMVESMNV